MHSEGERTKFTDTTSEAVMLMSQISNWKKNVVLDLREIENWFQCSTLL